MDVKLQNDKKKPHHKSIIKVVKLYIGALYEEHIEICISIQ